MLKAFTKKIGDLLTDSKGDGDVVRVFGIVLMIAGLVAWLWLGKSATESLAVVGFGGVGEEAMIRSFFRSNLAPKVWARLCSCRSVQPNSLMSAGLAPSCG